MAPSFSRVSSGALLLALAYNARPVNADFWEDVDNCKLVLDDLPADLTTDFCQDWTHGYVPEDEYVTVTGYPVTVTEYPDAKTCEGEGYSTTTKYPESTPKPSKGYWASKPTTTPDYATKFPDENTKVPDQTTKAPDQSSATYAPGGYDVTVTSTTWTTYWTTSTVYEGYPTATPAPYRRHAREVKARASWCVDRPCRLVQYDDDTIFEACKKYLGWEPTTSTVNVPGYTVTVTSYPTDCKKKDDGYKPEPVPAYPTEKDDGYKPEPYPTTSEYQDYPTKTPDYEPEPYPTTSEYPATTPEYEPEPYPAAPAPYPEDKPSYDDGNDDGQYNDGTAPGDNDNTDDYEHSDDKQPWGNDFDTNYSGPDGPLPWDDVDQTSELADAIDAVGYDSATQELGLDDAPWNALPADYPQKRDYPFDSYDGSYGEDGFDSEEPSYDDNSYDDGSEGDYGVYAAPEDSYDSYEPEPEPEPSYEPSYEPEPTYEASYEPEPTDEPSYEPESYEPEPSYEPQPSYAVEDSYKPEPSCEPTYEPKPSYEAEDAYKPTEDESYKPTEDKKEDSHPEEYAPNIYGPDVPESGDYSDDKGSEDYAPNVYGPDVPESGSYESSDDYESSPAPYPEDDSSYDGSYDEDYSKWVLPDSSEYEGDEFESDYNGPSDYYPDASSGDYSGEDGVNY